MFEVNIPEDLKKPGGLPDFKKVLQFLRDEMNAEVRNRKRGVFSKPLPPRYPHFGLIEAFEVLDNDDFFRDLCWAELAPLLCDSLYEGLLRRSPDSSGRVTFTTKIARDKSLLPAINSVLKSPEYLQKNANSSPVISVLAGLVEQALRIGARYGKHDLSLQDLAEVLGPELALGRLHKRLLQSDPVGWPKKKVLLLGAFGDGSMENAYQALAMRDHVHRCLGVPPELIFACSAVGTFDYPFPDPHKRPSDSILNTDTLNQFGLLVVCGGGEGSPYAPLLAADWVSKLTLPVVLVGFRASTATSDKFAPLTRLALAVSGCNTLAVKPFASSRLIAEMVPDAIGSSSDLLKLMMLDPPLAPSVQAALADEGTQPFDWLWVVKHPSNPGEQLLLDTIRHQIDSQRMLNHGVVAIDPPRDKVLQDQFPEVKLLSTLSHFWSLIQRSQRVCSMQFQGGILALRQNKPVVGCAQERLKSLVEDWGADLIYVENSSELPQALSNCASVGAGFQIDAMRSAMDQFMDRVGQHG